MASTGADVAERRFNDCSSRAANYRSWCDRESWFKLQRELRAIAIRHDHLLRKEETRKWKLIGKEGKATARQR
jgi:hypothetical protein